MSVRNALSAILLGSLSVAGNAEAPAPIVWPEGKLAAIVLTYDDGMISQLDVAVPQLKKAGLKGTFFLDTVGDFGPPVISRWQEVHRAGHELGNHSGFHPCPRAMLPDGKHTEDYDVEQMLGEIYAMNLTLFLIDGEKRHTYSAPCSQMLVGGVDYTEALRGSRLVEYTRTGGDAYKSVVTDFRKLDAFAVPSWGPVDSPGGEQLITYVKRVAEARGLGVLQFHGIGGEYLSVSAEAHQALLEYLQAHPEIWVGTFRAVMDYVVAHSR
jgi:peptidoglycan-N-acetylglucosamine deacetylase